MHCIIAKRRGKRKPRRTKVALIVIFLNQGRAYLARGSLAALDALELAEILVVRLLIGAVEDRVFALVQRLNIVVVVVHDVLIEHRERKDADIRALVGDALHIDENIEEP